MVMEVGLPLVLLLAFSGMAVGATVLAAISELIDLSSKSDRFSQWARFGAYTALPTLGIGLLASMFHLSKPLSFSTGMVNFGSSWISREGVFGLIFLIIALVYALIWFLSDRGKKIPATPRVAVAVLSAVAALCLICSTGMAYTIVKPIPVWNTPLTIAFFIISACVMGALLVGGVIAIASKIAKGERAAKLKASLAPLPQLATILLLALVVVEILRLIHLGTSTDAALMSAEILGGSALVLTLLRWIVGLAIPLALMLYACLNGRIKAELLSLLVIASLVCVLVGEIVARVLFFLAAVHI